MREREMDHNLLIDQLFSWPVNIADTPWSVENLIFEENLTSGSNNDIADLFNGEREDQGFDGENTISNLGIPTNIKEIGDEEIKNLRVQELNKLLRGMPRDEAAKIRRKRRNLKNRGYALTCRIRRQQFQEILFKENQLLKKQLEDDREKLRKVLKERNIYKRKFQQLQSACKGELVMQPLVHPSFPLEAGSVV